jgi:iron complex outermembrane receptor protein
MYRPQMNVDPGKLGVAGSACLAIFALSAPCVVTAQQTQPAQLEEIIITAERRPENLQSAATTVTAVTAADLERNAIIDTQSLPALVPGLVISNVGGYAEPFIRGVGTLATGPGAEPSVTTYVDGVYMPDTSATLFSFNNIAQIEVDKGPQGTLFGRNATGGVIQVTTRDPTATPKLDVSVGYGNYGTYESKLYGSIGVASDLAADIAVLYRDQSQGWGRYVLTGDDAFTSHDIAIRNKWLWTPFDATRVTFSADYETAKSGNGVIAYPYPGTVSVTGQGFLGAYLAPGRYSYSQPEDYGASLKLEQGLGWADLTSISAYGQTHYYAPFDYGAVSIPTVYAIFNSPGYQLSQEIRLASPQQSAVKWVGGVFYSERATGFSPIAILETRFPPEIDTFARTKAGSIAAFGQTTVEVLPNTDLTAGLRYTRDRVSIAGYDIIHAIAGNTPLEANGESTGYGRLTWRAALAYHFTQDLLGYASYNRGYKSGLYSTDSFTSPAVNPEVIDAYETGVKSELFDHRVRVNLAGFYDKWSNIQVEQFAGAISYFVNAASATIYGFDLDTEANLVEGLTLRTSVSYAHGRYKSFTDSPSYFIPGTSTLNPAGAQIVDATGNVTTHTPDFTGLVSLDYSYPTRVGAFDVAVANSYTTSFYWEADNVLRQPNVDLLNGSIGWSSTDKRWDVRFYGQNLLKRVYYVAGFSNGLTAEASPAAPLTYGIVFGLHL